MTYKLQMYLFKDATPDEIATSLEAAAAQVRSHSIEECKDRNGYWSLYNQRPTPGTYMMKHGISGASS